MEKEKEPSYTVKTVTAEQMRKEYPEQYLASRVIEMAQRMRETYSPPMAQENKPLKR
ncbi:MAG: hypothetical protein LBV05_05635 [Comamonas sp.]|jgi:hypothetical protein|uniref:hypothetical protein n=1 Tax=Comamonas sp. TaxID=34028 RepID=UPI00284CD93F|nr:hypothetical protein [Comamonas sp.]MDR3064981.1 hypothetical protein [Comamonas sp.]